MIQEFQIRVLPEQAANEQSLKQFIGHDKGLDRRTIHALLDEKEHRRMSAQSSM